MTLATDPTATQPTDLAVDWLNPSDGKLYELINGQPVEKCVGMLSTWIASRISHLINIYIDKHDSGFVFTEPAIVGIWNKPRHGRRPDVGYVSKTALPVLREVGEIDVVPDLIVEVVSPHDHVVDLEDRIYDYMSVGVKVIWVVLPHQKLVRVHHADGTMKMLNITGTLDGASALPGFTCPVVDIFPKT